MARSEDELDAKKRSKLEHDYLVIEKRDRYLLKDQSIDHAVIEEVFDRSTLMVLYDLLNQGVLDSLYGVVKAGKEARVYWGVTTRGESLAVKIYLMVASEFRKFLPYIQGDTRFKSVRKGSRSLIYAWAQKEYKNLQRAHEAGVRVPTPIRVAKNVLVMEFIGEDGVAAPTLKDQPPKRAGKVYAALLRDVKTLYTKAKLVHADLSEYNVMTFKGHHVIFDMAQAVLVDHPMAQTFLERDLQNLNRFFGTRGVEVRDVDELTQWVKHEAVTRAV
jgi:RIO kinase 1